MNDHIPARSFAGRRQLRLAMPIIAAVAIVLSGCSGASGDGGDAAVGTGGQIVIGAEQEPECADWIATCAANIWGSYTMRTPTMPTAFDTRRVGEDWKLVPSDLLDGEPTVDVTADGKQVITYRINPDAVWSDGEPISGADFVYTGLEIRDGDDIFDKTGYSLIESIDAPDEKTAVVTMSSTYGQWRGLFSGDFQVLPSHLLEGKDRAAIMKDGYAFSGGPWMIESWKKGTSVTLVPNEAYWGDKPKLDRVTFQFITDTSAAFQALKSGQVQALYPTPQLDAISQIEAGVPNTTVDVETESGNLEALWINNEAFPFDDVKVRQAVAYAIDRPAIVEKLYGGLGVDEAQQSFLSPLNSAFASDDFSQYTHDLDRVDDLMSDAGWSKGSSGIWEKAGRQAEFRITTHAGNKRRELAEQILQSQLGDAGFVLKVANKSGSEIFSKTAPEGDFEIGLWTLIDTVPEPTLSASFVSTAIPSAENGYSGINFVRTRIDGLDPLLETVARSVDDEERLDASLQAERLIADNLPGLPLAAVPNILMTSQRISGPLEINPSEGPFWNLHEWTVG
ncbi:ABC transporter substrate-binding protein [Microbacterium sp. NPDC058342]|uniref:ABC transporter substrate-binding protein n=1 Tax=Microbacterium sp. NPDC058342 TaxID=3346454 RepID=UPI0036669053